MMEGLLRILHGESFFFLPPASYFLPVYFKKKIGKKDNPNP